MLRSVCFSCWTKINKESPIKLRQFQITCLKFWPISLYFDLRQFWNFLFTLLYYISIYYLELLLFIYQRSAYLFLYHVPFQICPEWFQFLSSWTGNSDRTTRNIHCKINFFYNFNNRDSKDNRTNIIGIM